LALRGLVMFPHMVLHFDVGRPKSVFALDKAMNSDRRIFLVALKDIADDDPDLSQLYKIGVVAEIRQVVRSQGGSLRVLVDGKYRAKLIELISEDDCSIGMISPFPVSSRISNKPMCGALMRTVKNLFSEYCALSPQMPKELITTVLSSENPVYVTEYIAGNIPFKLEDKQKLLEITGVLKRLEVLAKMLENENEIQSLENDIHDRVKEQIESNQKEYYLREQMKIISSELGEGDGALEEVEEYHKKITALSISQESADKLHKEVAKLDKMPYNSQEAAVIRGYLDTVLELPWNKPTKDKIDIKKAAKLLDAEHYGLKKVKSRILELLAVRKLAPDIKGQIICLVGPPGVGKTSIARSMAESMGRKYARISLGGVRDEAEIRGHRKTYIGSMPGRIINALKLAGSSNPLLLLDEIDKLGNDYKGDPSSALLEVLDAEQNSSFRDHFIEIPFDLSDVLFVTTANDMHSIPAPLLDRMDIIELSSYTREEKKEIARRHLIPKQAKKHGLTAKEISISDDAIYGLIDTYTREAGVRNLEREIASLCRKTAAHVVSGDKPYKTRITAASLEALLGPGKYKNDDLQHDDQIGIVNGLAWTAVGGEMLSVEVAVLEGTGKNQFTGSLGDVMKESVSAAITYIRSVASDFGISSSFYKDKDLHIHFPEGAVPKDGPSAGITICTALVSALSGIAVHHDVAMTGEITLRGRVLPIGGLREKTMAAFKNGMKTVIIPKANLSDLAEIDPVVKNGIKFVPVSTMDEVLEYALCSYPKSKIQEPVQPITPKVEIDVCSDGTIRQ